MLLAEKPGALTFSILHKPQPIMPIKLLHKELVKSSSLFSQTGKYGCSHTFKIARSIALQNIATQLT